MKRNCENCGQSIEWIDLPPEKVPAQISGGAGYWRHTLDKLTWCPVSLDSAALVQPALH